jgi:hypothetical protein
MRNVVPDVPAARFSNGCARGLHPGAVGRLFLVWIAFAVLLCSSSSVAAQDPPVTQKTSGEHHVASIPTFLAGAAIGLGAHEAGHLLFDGLFNADPGLKKVSFHGIPFFAITHEDTLSHRKEFVIDSAGFWVQQIGNEIILTRNPNVRQNGSSLVKGLIAFNVIASVAYSTAAFARTGPVERDTRGMADALRWKEPWIGVLILAPAILDAIRYYNPGAKWATWSSRSVKVGMVLLVIR